MRNFARVSDSTHLEHPIFLNAIAKVYRLEMAVRGRLMDVYQLSNIARKQGPRVLAENVKSQMSFQHRIMEKGSFRRPAILDFFHEKASMNELPADIGGYAFDLKRQLQTELDRLVSDGNKWGGYASTPDKYRQPINEVFSQCFYTLALFDILMVSCSEAVDLNETHLLARPCDLRHLTACVADDLHGLSIEKFGVCPAITILPNHEEVAPTVDGIWPLLQYSCVEIVKNSIQAVIDRFGELEIDDLDEPPIVVDCCNANEWVFKDDGTGLVSGSKRSVISALSSTRKKREPNYTYSRDFGVPFSGAGIGLLKCKTYLGMHNATIEARSRGAGDSQGLGTTITVHFKNGLSDIDKVT